MKRQEASYTVELSLLLPVVVLVLFAPVHMGFALYGQTKEASACGWDAAFCAEERVRSLKWMEKRTEGLR